MTPKREWYLLDRETYESTGPFSDADIQSRIKSGEVKLDDFIWANHLGGSDWKRVFEIDDFKSVLNNKPRLPAPKVLSRGLAESKDRTVAQMDHLKRREGNYGKENLYRRYPRAPIKVQVIIHNDYVYTKGETVDINEKGVFVHVSDLQNFEKGDEVIVTLRDAPVLGTLSIPSVILRVHNDPSPGYGVYFLRINPNLRRLIAEYVLKELGLKEPQSA